MVIPQEFSYSQYFPRPRQKPVNISFNSLIVKLRLTWLPPPSLSSSPTPNPPSPPVHFLYYCLFTVEEFVSNEITGPFKNTPTFLCPSSIEEHRSKLPPVRLYLAIDCRNISPQRTCPNWNYSEDWVYAACSSVWPDRHAEEGSFTDKLIFTYVVGMSNGDGRWVSGDEEVYF